MRTGILAGSEACKQERRKPERAASLPELALFIAAGPRVDPFVMALFCTPARCSDRGADGADIVELVPRQPRRPDGVLVPSFLIPVAVIPEGRGREILQLWRGIES